MIELEKQLASYAEVSERGREGREEEGKGGEGRGVKERGGEERERDGDEGRGETCSEPYLRQEICPLGRANEIELGKQLVLRRGNGRRREGRGGRGGKGRR